MQIPKGEKRDGGGGLSISNFMYIWTLPSHPISFFISSLTVSSFTAFYVYHFILILSSEHQGTLNISSSTFSLFQINCPFLYVSQLIQNHGLWVAKEGLFFALVISLCLQFKTKLNKVQGCSQIWHIPFTTRKLNLKHALFFTLAPFMPI